MGRLAKEVPGQAWLSYDKLFRQAVAVNRAQPWIVMNHMFGLQ